MRVSPKLLLLILLVGLTSCATKYTRMSDGLFSDHTGYTEAPIDETTWQVTFGGNEATAPEVVERYALFRAAEITVEKGYDYFIVMDKANNADLVLHTGVPMTSTSPPQSSTDLATHTTTTTTVSTTTQSV